jgi:hypothetical protein
LRRLLLAYGSTLCLGGIDSEWQTNGETGVHIAKAVGEHGEDSVLALRSEVIRQGLQVAAIRHPASSHGLRRDRSGRIGGAGAQISRTYPIWAV